MNIYQIKYRDPERGEHVKIVVANNFGDALSAMSIHDTLLEVKFLMKVDKVIS